MARTSCMIGILPTLMLEHLQGSDWMSPSTRYRR